jgi:hypothetical protein
MTEQNTNAGKYTVNIPRYIAEFSSATHFDADGEACLISITEPGGPEANLLGSWSDVFRTAFWDVTNSRWGMAIAGQPDEMIDTMMEGQAKTMAEFIRKHWDENIIVHCKAGISRSAAVVRVLTELGWQLHPTCKYHDQSGYNSTVYGLLKRQFPELLPEGAV